MRIRTVGAWAAFSAFGTAFLHAQIAPPVTQLGLSGSNLQSAVVRGDGTPTNVLVPVSNPPTSDDLFDILTSDPATQISVLLPNGTEIIPADGTSASGLTFVVYTVPDDASDDALSTLLIPGRHVVVQFSSAAAGGQYTVKAIGSGNDSGLTVIYTPSSGPSVAAITDSSSYRLGDMVILSALVFNGTTPVTQASVQATIGGLLPVQGTIGNYQLTNQLQISSTMTRYSYTAQLTANAAASSVIATASNSEPQSKLVADTIWFGDVPASAPVTSQTFFTIERPTAEPFDPSTLQWRISSIATPTTVTLLDSGAYDVASGDGIFTGTFTPPAVGDYTAFVTVSFGTAPSDRTASTTFHVTPLRARFASFRENVSYAADNSIAQVFSLATLNVSQPGTYRYDLQLTASNGSVVRATGQADLIAGTQDIAVQFTPDQLRSLGVDGPWERIQARLTYSPAADAELTDYMADAGSTSAFTLSSLQRVPPYLTGQNSAQGIDANGVPGFEIFRVQIGIVASGSSCHANAVLASSTGATIDFADGTSAITNLTPSFLTFDFSGPKIARSGDPGPFSLRQLTGDCLSVTPPAPNPISGFSASQFESQPMGIGISVSPNSQPVLPGGQVLYRVSVSSLGGFQGPVSLSVAGLPPSATAAFTFLTVVTNGTSSLTVATASTTPAGTYQLSITAQSGGITGTAAATLIVATQTTPPSASSILPGSGSGLTGTFAVTAVAAHSATRVVSAQLVLGPGGSGPGRCFIYYIASIATLYLADDSGTSWIGSAPIGNSTAVFSNSQCSLDVGQSSVLTALDGTWLQLNLKLTFAASFQGDHPWNLRVLDTSGLNSGWSQIGNWVVSPPAATPTFSPPAGTYTTAQTVTISTSTSGASIRYTADGSTPTSSSGTVYSGPVSISTTATLKAIAYATGMTDSAVAAATYTIQVATPTFSPAAGTYTSTQSVAISTTTSGATIRYTTDGSTPTASTGTVYSGAVTVSTTTTIKAIAYATSMSDSAIASATYTIQVTTPTFSPLAGTYAATQSVTISTTTAGAAIRYTTDGSTPTSTTGTLYSGPITVGSNLTLSAIAYKTGLADSAVGSSAYTIIRDLLLENMTLGSGTTTYQAINSITADNLTVNGSAAITFTTGNTIDLKPGFQATAGSAGTTFHAVIDPLIQ